MGSGNIVNQVLYEYDARGQLAKEYQSFGSAVNTSTTPYVGYSYDTTKSGDLYTKRLRPNSLRYPSGRTLSYVYGSANSNDDRLNRFTQIKDGNTVLVTYVDNGVATPVKVTYNQPGLVLDYTASTAWDRFGHVIDHAWKKSTTDVVRIKHGYDRVATARIVKMVLAVRFRKFTPMMPSTS